MDCKFKSEVFFNALRAEGIDTKEMKQAVLSADEVYDLLSNHSDIIDVEDFEGAASEKEAIIKALKNVKQFRDFGLIVPKTPGPINNAVMRFMNNLIIDPDQSKQYLSDLVPITVEEDGTITSELNEEEINNIVKDYFGLRLQNVDKAKYVKKKGDKIHIYKRFATDMNSYSYTKYLNDIGYIAGVSVSTDYTPPEYDQVVSNMVQGPILQHIQSEIDKLVKKRRNMFEAVDTGQALDYTEREIINTNISALNKLSDELQKNQDLSQNYTKVRDYLSEILDSLENDLNQPQTIIPDLESVVHYWDTIALIKNMANPDNAINRVLEEGDITMYKDTVLKAFKELRNRAEDLEVDLKRVSVASAIEIAKETLGGDIENWDSKEFTTIKGMKNWFQQTTFQVLSPRHIQNPIINTMYTKVMEAVTKSMITANRINDDITDLYKSMKKAGIEDTLFYQVDKDGNYTGKLVDPFAVEYYENLHKVIHRTNVSFTNKDEFKIRKRAVNKGLRERAYMALNPVLLKGENLSKEENQEREALIKKVHDAMGEYMGNVYMKRAVDLFDTYEATYKTLEKRGVSKQELNNFYVENSPIYRLNNWKNENIEDDFYKGTDNYLILVANPENDTDKEDYFDQNYQKILGDEKAENFYNKVREVFIQNKKDLGHYENLLVPPNLSFITESVEDLIRKKDFAGAARLMGKNIATNNIPVQTIRQLEKIPTNEITGEYDPKLRLEVHTINTEIRRRAEKSLKDNKEYQQYLQDEDVFKTQIEELEKQANRKAKREVESIRSDNLLQSVVMSNYAVQTYAEKRMIESELKLMKHLLDNDVISTEYSQEKKEKGDKGQKRVKDAIKHFIDVQYYDMYDKAIPAKILTLKKNDDGTETAITSRQIVRSILSYGRTAILGWSPKLALLNLGQNVFSASFKALEGNDFDMSQFWSGLNEVRVSEKARKIVNRLYIAGDIGYAYDKLTIHEQNKVLSKLHPMKLQTTVEKINQGSVAVAIMKNIKLTDGKNEIDLYSALDENINLDKKWKHEAYGNLNGDALLAKITTSKIRPVVQQIAGDYVTPYLIEQKEWGPLVTMFKKFMPEMLLDRFKGHRYDYNLQRWTVGRLNAFWAGLNAFRKGSFQQDIKTDPVKMQAFLAGMKETLLVGAGHVFFLAFAKLLCDTKECREQKPAIIAGLNILGRLTNDATELMVPAMLIDQAASPFAAYAAVEDWGRFINDFSSWLVPGGDDGLYKKTSEYGYRGDPKFRRSGQKILPFVRTNIYGLNSLKTQLYVNSTQRAFIEN